MGRWRSSEERAIRAHRVCNLWMRGASVREIAERLSTHTKTVYNILRENGLFSGRAGLPSGSPDKTPLRTLQAPKTQALGKGGNGCDNLKT